jgi:dihydroorotase
MSSDQSKPPAIQVLRGARVLDPGLGIDQTTDVLVQDGVILDIGDNLAPPQAEITDLQGYTLTPGWIDAHVHVYGALGFADPDSIGIWQGVTTFVDAGGPGIASMDEFMALVYGRTATNLYAGPYIRPLGIIGGQFTENDVRSLNGFPIPQWLDFIEKNPGVIRFLKIAALSGYGRGVVKMGKGLAEIIGVPLYGHIGEFQMQPEDPCVYELFSASQAGDIIAHPYHNSGGRILDRAGKLLPVVIDAQQRGVLFDIAFGSYNFSWEVAEAAFAQGLPPDIISSDLQQYSAIGPAYSLSHVMSLLLRLGMSFTEVIKAVTTNPAKALSLQDRAGSLRKGAPAELTVCHIVKGKYEFADTEGRMRDASEKIIPVAAFKDGKRYGTDLARCQNEDNWLLQIADDHIPDAAARLSRAQLRFLEGIKAALAGVSWTYDLANLDLEKAHEMRAVFDAVRLSQGIALRDALLALFACFLDRPFTMQVGLLLLHVEKEFLLTRLDEVLAMTRAAA